jgi:hypothetical protein
MILFAVVADHIIDLGPEGGEEGGYVIATGTPEQVAKVKESYTGQYLKKILEQDLIEKGEWNQVVPANRGTVRSNG